MPYVFRNTKYQAQEKNILRELVTLHPTEFIDDHTTLDKLVRMQHFSLPTRLLDVTSNPLAALFFACKEYSSRTAEVIKFVIQKRDIKYFDSDTVSCLANLANMTTAERNYLRKAPDKTAMNAAEIGVRLLHSIRQEKPYFLPIIEPNDLKRVVFIKAKQSNRRILAQQGAFLLFGLTRELTDHNLFGIRIERTIINHSAKDKILAELDAVGINQSTMFPEIEMASKYILSKISPTV
jgi:hypothetical protein